MNYPLNCWYVVATSDEVGRSLLARHVLGGRLLLFRTQDGQAAVLDDRCPHRAAPLSMGTLDGDRTLITWRGARNYAPGDESVTARLRDVYEGTMTEDQPLLEAIQATTGGVVNYQVSAAADAAAIRAYQIIEALLAEERGWASPPQPATTQYAAVPPSTL